MDNLIRFSDSIELDEEQENLGDFFYQISEVIPAILCVFSANLDKVFYVSPSFERIFGRSCEKLYQNPKLWFHYIHQEDRQRILEIEKTQFGEEYEINYRIIRPDGEIRWMKDRVIPIKGKSEKVIRILRFVEDITENKQIEEALRDSFQRSVDIVKAIPSGLLIYQFVPEDKFILIDSNPAAERMINININDYRGSEIRDVWLNADSFGLIDKCLSVINNGETIEIDDLEYRDERFEGSFRIRIFRMPANQIGIALENITELKKSDEMLAQAYALGRIETVDTLIHNIGNAINSVTTGIGTLQEILSNKRLTRYISSLANAVKAHQDDFISYITNDPQGQKVVPFILALSDDLEKQEEELTKIVNRVRDRAQHIADIVRTEKLISGKGIYRKQINLQKAINDAINVLQESIKKRNIEVSIDCELAPKEILIQESQFHQMLINLVKNSIEAIDDLYKLKSNDLDTSKPSINIKCYADDDNLVISVVDNGIGIEKDKLEAIFRPGYTTKESGSGLGLHSVANFIKTCNGHINAISEGLCKGTTMQAVFPLSSVT
ncbi:TPA: PAS domain S-box protein [Candidatus Poribacteria bacterium]|nr:PAS domain S-box protein [Candidatus Poribacteria bacterium]